MMISDILESNRDAILGKLEEAQRLAIMHAPRMWFIVDIYVSENECRLHITDAPAGYTPWCLNMIPGLFRIVEYERSGLRDEVPEAEWPDTEEGIEELLDDVIASQSEDLREMREAQYKQLVANVRFIEDR